MTQYKHIDISSVVQIEGWDDLEDVLAGSRVKTTVSNPKKAAPENNNLYIFKHPKPQREAQIWSELIASYIPGVSETLCMRVGPCEFHGSFVEPFWI